MSTNERLIVVDRNQQLSPQECAEYVTSKLRNRRNQKPLSATTIQRWFTIGVRGVRLQCTQIGARRFTTPEAIDHFFDSLAVKGSAAGEPASRNNEVRVSAAPATSSKRKRLGTARDRRS
jgi:hypothetical protein